MASAEIYHCPVCKRAQHDLCLLNCSHSFCEKCISDHSEQLPNQQSEIKCPECQSVTLINDEGMKALLSIRKVKKFMTDQVKKRPETTCNVCHNERRSVHCKDCSKHMCTRCNVQHQNTSAFQNHSVVQVNDDSMNCDAHVGESLEYFCRQCCLGLCAICAQNHNHEMEVIKHAITRMRESLGSQVQELTPVLKKLEHKRAELERLDCHEVLQSDWNDAQTKIKQAAQKKIMEIEQMEAAMLHQLDEKCQAEIRKFDLKMETINVAYATADTLQEYITQLKDKDIVTEYKDISERVTSLKSRVNDIEFVYPKGTLFKAAEPSPSFQLGSLKEYVVEPDYINARPNQPPPPPPPRSKRSQSVPAPPPKPNLQRMVSATAALMPPTRNPKLIINVDTSKMCGPSALSYGVALHFMQDHKLVASDPQRGGLFIVFPNGQLQKLTKSGALQPQGITIHPNGTIYVCDGASKCVQMFDDKSVNLGQWGTFSDPCGISIIENGNFIVSDKKQIFAFDITGQSLFTFGHGASKGGSVKKPRFLTSNSKGSVIVQDSESMSLKIFNSCGKFQKMIKLPWKHVEDVFDYQSICTDKVGHIYVVQKKLNNVAKFSPDGQMIEQCFKDSHGLVSPCAVAIGPGGQMAISEISDTHSAVKVFEMPQL